MKLSIRSKIIFTYGLLVLLFVGVVAVSFYRVQKIGASLSLVQTGYLPIVKTVNSFFNFYHLDDTFDVNKIMANSDNALFIESITIHNPRLLETELRRSINDARSALSEHSPDFQQQALGRITELAESFLLEHRRYAELLRSVVSDILDGESAKAIARNEELLQGKRLIRSRVDFLSRQIDNRIRSTISSAVREEKTTLLTTLILSAITLAFGLFIVLIAIFSLRPLDQLKEVAREIAAGDLQKRARIHTEDEVGDLAREFNKMADAIQERDVALHQQQEQLLQSERMAVVGRMASKISHEVRNPLNALSLNVELLADELKAEPAKKTLQSISEEIERLRQVTENYLSLSRSPRQGIEETDVGAMLDHLVSIARPECEERGLHFRAEISEFLPKIRTNASRLEQAVLNLVRNAMDALPHGGLFGLRAKAEEKGIVIEVWDRGPGISEDIRSRIFEPFFSTKEKGTGLGLAIAAEIVRDQQGTISCISALQEGTQFTIHLPIA